ncbi:non-canonical purine NTP pyrophosphatase [Prochlorococcus marinus]|uniref:Non-canonical purine NTP pyrophosphatase n=1 Tax=Prochlorococcus marinus XMU1408 TaxID=2213228 RepID=A0A318R9Q9_PROMR|nr:non-canonical purine NTP pyrophosphatase [Prochlorococcus marinus]MBW3041573.1 non-canonical purine NTP pyrophosphatase [Prochlorococcus marinus str. XMU1408]PYE02729.1 non-canonical purine NTP pyrophosphatase [Prochlorococcus marinus XMU1408]
MKKPLITIASGNPKKVAEIEAMLGPLPIEVKKQPSSLDVEETGKTYLDNAILKAKAAAAITNSWTIADDSGLEIDSLGNAPGIFSARLADTNEEKIAKILTALGDSPYRSAKVCSVMVLCTNSGEIVKNAIGICWGEILKKPAYPNGEFESLFWVRETNCTYGELNNAQLSKHGSRGKAARELAPYLLKAIGIKNN